MENKIIIYQTEDGLTKISVTLEGDTVWLTQAQMAELFQRDKSVISKHITNIFAEGELERNSVVANFATTASDGKTYQVEYDTATVRQKAPDQSQTLSGTPSTLVDEMLPLYPYLRESQDLCLNC